MPVAQAQFSLKQNKSKKDFYGINIFRNLCRCFYIKYFKWRCRRWRWFYYGALLAPKRHDTGSGSDNGSVYGAGYGY